MLINGVNTHEIYKTQYLESTSNDASLQRSTLDSNLLHESKLELLASHNSDHQYNLSIQTTRSTQGKGMIPILLSTVHTIANAQEVGIPLQSPATRRLAPNSHGQRRHDDDEAKNTKLDEGVL